MSNALIIPGTDFSTNKVATVSFLNPVPCTGITLPSTATMTKVGSTLALAVSVTPLNTTDSIIWSSSNPLVVDVQGGTLIQKGIGTATITAVCGVYSATCSVSTTHIINTLTDAFVIKNTGCIPAGKDYLRYVSPDATTQGYIQYFDKYKDGYPAINNQTSLTENLKNRGAFAIPYGASKISVTNPDTTIFTFVSVQLMNKNQLCTQSTVNDSAKYIKQEYNEQMQGVTAFEVNLSNVTGDYNAFAVLFNCASKPLLTDDYHCTIMIT